MQHQFNTPRPVKEEMEPLPPNPRLQSAGASGKSRATRPRAPRRSSGAAASSVRSSKSATAKPGGATARAKSAQVKEQPRDNEGKFASKGHWLFNFFDPTPKPPTSLKKVKRPPEQRSFSETRSVRPKAKSKRKKPIQDRGFFGRVTSLFNGDYTRYRKRAARQQSLAQYGNSVKKPVRRRRKPRRVPPKKRGFLNLFR